ncbi:hypothetical protein OPIT5_29340 [Opitutaceae bacterium TAV5]|nr:hypothetical protein OPIT5_21780 [Opitutaceae bacterium TAV5]AHF93683.1 hypothetical protein OPIT5_29340 [Opitutaceae bacterium TAV5]
MPTNLPTPPANFLSDWFWAAIVFALAGLWIWSHFRKPPRTELEQPVEVSLSSTPASKNAIRALFAKQDEMRREFEQKLLVQRSEIMAAIDKNRAEQREDMRQIFDLLRALSAESKATAALVDQINRRIT